jgi:hypothetical protein
MQVHVPVPRDPAGAGRQRAQGSRRLLLPEAGPGPQVRGAADGMAGEQPGEVAGAMQKAVVPR